MITTLQTAGVTYTPIVSDKVTGSVFRSIATGVATPREISIRHQDYVDSKTKKSGKRSVIRLDRYVELADGSIAPVSFMCIAMVPTDVNVTSAIIEDVLALAHNMHAGHATSTDIGLTVFASGEQ